MKRNRLKNVHDQGKRGTKRKTDDKIGLKNRNIGTPFSMDKLEWCRYPMV